MSVTLKTHDAKMTTSKEIKGQPPVETEEKIGQLLTATQPVMVGVSAGVTINLGNYCSAKASVHISIPCENTEEDIENTYEFAKNFVDAKLTKIKDEIEGA